MTRGTIANPFTLAEALQSARIRPGQTLYLRGGTYSGDFVSVIEGTQAEPITVRPYGSEKPIIDGSLRIDGADTTWQDLEIRYSGWSGRVSSQSGSAPTDLPVGKAFDVYGARTCIKDCTLHDLASIGLWITAIGSTFEGCLVYNQGWSAPDRGHGHCLYTQNQQIKKTIKNCVLAGGYSEWGLHGYTEGSYVQNYDYLGNIMLNKVNIFDGGSHGVTGVHLDGNIVYGGALSLYSSTANGSADAVDTELLNGAQLTAQANFTSWSETGTNATLGNRILTRGRFVAVCNAAGASSVSAPSAGTYTNALNPAESVVLEAGAALAMTGWTVATPTAAASPILTTTFPSFGVFILS